MEIKYKEKPSKELVERYRSALEKMLRYQHVTVEIELRESPIEMGGIIEGGKKTEITYLWIQDIKISSQEVEELSVLPFRWGIDDDIDNEAIWMDAWWVQQKLYNHLGRNPGAPSVTGDRYWKLWDFLKT